jgi:hypothetical protein
MIPNNILEADQIITWLEVDLVPSSPEVVAFLGCRDIGRTKLVGEVCSRMAMELSKPVQVWLGFPPVQADHSSLVTRVIPPISGTRGLFELEEAGNSTGAVIGVGNSKTDSSLVARVLA